MKTQHPTTLRERQARFQQSLIDNYRRHEGLGRMKRQLRRLKHQKD